MKTETNERNPLKWSEVFAAAVLRIVSAYVRKWSGADSPRELSPDDREEITARIIMDIMANGPVPVGVSAMHYVFRICRRWRLREWYGDTESNRNRMRAERAAAKKSLRDPGSRESEEGRNKSPFRGVSDDARQPTPLSQLVAIESATIEGLRYVSDRQRKARRKPVKGKPGPVSYRVVVVGYAGRPRVGFGANGRPLFFPGAATRIAYVPSAPTHEVGEWDKKARKYRPYVPYTGTVGHRAIGKTKTDAIGQDAIGQAMARMAILGRTESRRFIPAQPPTVGIPAQPGDGTAIRPCRQ